MFVVVEAEKRQFKTSNNAACRCKLIAAFKYVFNAINVMHAVFCYYFINF